MTIDHDTSCFSCYRLLSSLFYSHSRHSPLSFYRNWKRWQRRVRPPRPCLWSRKTWFWLWENSCQYGTIELKLPPKFLKKWVRGQMMRWAALTDESAITKTTNHKNDNLVADMRCATMMWPESVCLSRYNIQQVVSNISYFMLVLAIQIPYQRNESFSEQNDKNHILDKSGIPGGRQGFHGGASTNLFSRVNETKSPTRLAVVFSWYWHYSWPTVSVTIFYSVYYVFVSIHTFGSECYDLAVSDVTKWQRRRR